MNIRLVNNASTLALGKEFKMSISPYVKRLGLKPRYGKDGDVPLADQYVGSRTIILDYHKYTQDGTTQARDLEYRTFLNNLTAFFDPLFAPYFLEDLDNSIRCQVLLEEHADNPSQPGMQYRLGLNQLKLKMLNGHWEDITENTVSPTGAFVNGDDVNINNDSLFRAFPVITLTAINSATEVTITNTTTGEGFTIGNNNFLPGSVLIIDSRDGIIELDGVDVSNSLADGSGFISLAPGVNTLVYESAVSGEVILSVSFRRRYAH